jgi:hypothetical protein
VAAPEFRPPTERGPYARSMSTMPPPPPPPPPGFGAIPPPPSGPSIQTLANRGYASWGRRVGGYVMRTLTAFVIYLPTVIVGQAIGDAGFILVLVGVVFACAASIRMLIQRGHLGYDVGDAAMGQTLLREGSMQPMGSGWSTFGRSIAHILDALPCYLGFLWPIWDKKRQTFADKVAGTVVVASQSHAHDAGDLFKNALLFWTPVLKS